MKKMVLTGVRRMEMREAPSPRLIRPTDVLLRVEAVGVCGSDVHYYTAGRIGEKQVVEYPWTLGHECAARVEETGPEVVRVGPGDLVALDPAMSCGGCDQCAAGRPHTCRNLRFLACPGQAEGCLCEHIVMPEASCYPVGPETTPERAALCEPLSVGVYAVRLAGSGPGRRVGILGSGPIGLSVLAAAGAAGVERVYVTDKIESRLAAARSAGAVWGGNPDTADVTGEILALEPDGLDAVFECCGRQEALDQATDLLRPGGKLMLIGIPPERSRVSFRIDDMRRHELCIQNVRRQNGCMRRAIDLIEAGGASLDFMVTHRFPFDRAAAAFELAAAYEDGVIKAMIEI